MSTTQRHTLTIVGAGVAVLIALLGVLTGASLAGGGPTGVTVATAPAAVPMTTADSADSAAPDPNTPLVVTAPASASPAPASPAPVPQGDPQPTPDPEPEPAPEEPVAADCDAPHEQDTWTVDGPGEAVAITDMAPFGGECAGVFLTLDSPAGDMDVERHTTTDTTVVRFLGTGPGPGGIADDAIDFTATDSRISWAVAFSDAQGFGVVLYHPSAVGPDLGAHVDVDGAAVTISVREQTADDPQAVDAVGGGPRLPRGPVSQGLLVDRTDVDVDVDIVNDSNPTRSDYGVEVWTASVDVSGYAKAPGSSFELEIHDDTDALVCSQTGTTEGAPWHFSAYSITCELDEPGTYTISVGWPGTSEDPDGAWHVEEVTIEE